jgi:putative DNA methylase
LENCILSILQLPPLLKRRKQLRPFNGGDRVEARRFYEGMIADSFKEAHRVLKTGGTMIIVYAHKTTLGWSTLVEALRSAGFTVTEAWPLDTEMKSRLIAMGTASLASSIFLIARKRDETIATGNYEGQVQAELREIVRERVSTLWEMGVSGADLVIACVGAGLRAFTRFARVEYANGEEVPAERFLTEVEGVVLDTFLQKLSKAVGGNGSRQHSLAALDPATRFYVLWRYTYGAAELDAGEAIIFANGTHVELDGPLGLSTGSRALVEKKKGKYRLHDFVERGDDDELGVMTSDTAQSSATIDVLHRLLWLLEKRPPLIPDFIADAQPNLDQLRLVAQALAGPALKGGELENVSPSAEQSALGKLLANWSTVMEGKAAREDRRVGQQSLGI